MWHKIFKVSIKYDENVEAVDRVDAEKIIRNFLKEHSEVLEVDVLSLEGFDDLLGEEK